MRKTGLIMLLMGAIACGEEYFPPGLYASQVEWLLTGGSEKTWVLTNLRANGNPRELTDCTDSIRVLFQAQKRDLTTIETVEAYQLTYQEDCQTFDTVFYGNMRASAARTGNTNVFTDSLIFVDGDLDYLLIEAISSHGVTWRQPFSGEDRISELQEE